MKRVAIFPGSFAPFHTGHFDIVKQILPLFDEVKVVHLKNPIKSIDSDFSMLKQYIQTKKTYTPLYIFDFPGMLVDLVNKFHSNKEQVTIIKGLRNTNDFIYEQAMQYNNEDL